MSIPLTAFQFEFLAANQNLSPFGGWYISIFNLGVSCYPDLDMENLSVSLGHNLLLKQSPSVPNYIPLFYETRISIFYVSAVIILFASKRRWTSLMFANFMIFTRSSIRDEMDFTF